MAISDWAMTGVPMLDGTDVAILPDPALHIPMPARENRRLRLSPALFVGVPDDTAADALIFATLRVGGVDALEVRCPHPAGLAWMTLEFMFGEAGALAVPTARSIGLRLRAKALPAMTLDVKCGFNTADGAQVIDVPGAVELSHDFVLAERELPLAETSLARAAAFADLRMFLTFPQSRYFAALISHAEVFWR
jgi:hypothetical protein